METQFGSVAGSNKQLWRAIMYGKFDFEWPPWDTISGTVGAAVLLKVVSNNSCTCVLFSSTV